MIWSTGCILIANEKEFPRRSRTLVHEYWYVDEPQVPRGVIEIRDTYEIQEYGGAALEIGLRRSQTGVRAGRRVLKTLQMDKNVLELFVLVCYLSNNVRSNSSYREPIKSLM